MSDDIRSKKFVLIPFCLICQAFQANGIVKYGWRGTIQPITEYLIKQDVNLIQMPCPETILNGYENGLQRLPKGINYYDTKEFRKVCHKIAEETVDMVKGILSNDYEIIAILGIEYSPSCSVKYQYTNKGTIHRSGIFIETLKTMLDKENIQIPFVGINRRGIKQSLKKIEAIFNKYSQTTLTM